MTVIEHESQTSSSGLLDELDVLGHRQRECDARIMVAAVEFAVANGPETVDAAAARLPGRQRAVRVGGEGTPLVAEFAPALVGTRLGVSAFAGRRLVADGLDLAYRLPRLWSQVRNLRVRVGHARYVACQTRELSRERAVYVDAQVAELADGRLPWSRFADAVAAAVIASDPAAARMEEEQAACRSFAKTTQSDSQGMRGFFIRADFATIARIEATVAFLAGALAEMGAHGSCDELRVLAVLFMANPVQAVQLLAAYAAHRRHSDQTTHAPDGESDGASAGEPGRAPDSAPCPDVDPEVVRPRWFNPTESLSPDGPWFDISKLLPTVILYVHLATQTLQQDCQGVARVEGEAPLTATWVRDRLGPRCRFTITPVLDPLGQSPADAWEIPRRHRQAVHLMTPADTFPYACNRSRTMQIDHTVPYQPGGPAGQSRIGNYGPMVGFHHRLKTHGGWEVRQPFPGIYLWRDPHGAIYLVDHTGTRRLGGMPA